MNKKIIKKKLEVRVMIMCLKKTTESERSAKLQVKLAGK